MVLLRVPSVLLGNIKLLYVRRCRFWFASLLLMTATGSCDSESIDSGHWTRVPCQALLLSQIEGRHTACVFRVENRDTHLSDYTASHARRQCATSVLFLIQFICVFVWSSIKWHKSVTPLAVYGKCTWDIYWRNKTGRQLCRTKVLLKLLWAQECWRISTGT